MQETKEAEERWEAEAVSRLKDLLRLETVNPPGGERIAAEYLAEALEGSGIQATIVEAAPGRASVVGRVRGTGKKRPLLLAGHTDVVPVEREKWEREPFGAEEAEGHIWGRGAVDMKNMIAMSLMTVLRLKRSAVGLDRDVIFCAVADEEEGCRYGSRYVVEEHPSLVEAEYMLGEVGGFTMHVGGKALYPIQVGEKGRVKLKMIARGQPGHASMPFAGSAVQRLARAVDALGSRGLPHHKTAPAEDFIRALAESQGFLKGGVLKLLLHPAISDLLLERVIPKTLAGTFRAILHNTVAPTIMQAGVKLNVIPSEATCFLDGRLLPGFSGADLIREIRAIVGDEVELVIEEESNAVVHPRQTELYRLLEAKLRQHDPEAIPIPYLIPGFTDACQFSKIGMICYGFSPLQIPKNAPYTFSQLFHGHNERISRDGFLWGLRTLYDTVKTFCQTSERSLG